MKAPPKPSSVWSKALAAADTVGPEKAKSDTKFNTPFSASRSPVSLMLWISRAVPEVLVVVVVVVGVVVAGGADVDVAGGGGGVAGTD